MQKWGFSAIFTRLVHQIDLILVWYGMVWGEEGEPAWSPDIVNLKTALRAAQPDPSCI